MKALFKTTPQKIIHVDEWIPEDKDKIFKTAKGVIILEDISNYYGCNENCYLNSFIIGNKRAYNNAAIREHCVHYINYFLKFYDTEHELVMNYYRLKFLIDYEPSYSKEAFFYDLEKYFSEGSIAVKVEYMNEDNYIIDISSESPKNRVSSLQYLNKHGKLLMKLSLTINLIIPLLSHYMAAHNILNTTDFLLEIYDILINKSKEIDLYNKIYETSISSILKSERRNKGIWNLQDIRGINVTTHAINCCQNILINIIPKYKYSENIVNFNFISIENNTKYRVEEIAYEYSFIKQSSSNRDEDNNSEFDKYESFMIKQDESLFLQNQVAAKDTINLIELMYGPFDEIDFYKTALSSDGKCVIDQFQKELVFNLFYKYFGDPSAVNCINLDDYIKLVIAAKRLLEANKLVILPYIISGKVIRVANRRSISKKELEKIEQSPLYEQVKDKYKNDKIEKQIISILGIILTGEFQIIDPDDDELNGAQLEIVPELVCEEVLKYITLI